MFIIEKNGYYYRPNAAGYTTLKKHAGRYSFEDAAERVGPNGPDGRQDGLSMWREEDAPNHSACATREDILIAERDYYEEQVVELKKTLETIQYYFDSLISDNAELLEALDAIFHNTGSKINSGVIKQNMRNNYYD